MWSLEVVDRDCHSSDRRVSGSVRGSDYRSSFARARTCRARTNALRLELSARGVWRGTGFRGHTPCTTVSITQVRSQESKMDRLVRWIELIESAIMSRTLLHNLSPGAIKQ